MLRRFPASHVNTLMNQVRDLRLPLPGSHLRSPIRVAHTEPPRPAYELEELQCPEPISTASASPSAAQVSHPWPEWVDLMGTLSREGYLEGDGDGDPFRGGPLGPKESNSTRTACLNFARDRCQIMGSLSSEHMRTIVECGCPTTDRKVVNSGKRLRAHLGLDEGNVCSSCNLRGKCERAFVEAREGEHGRTVDVMRFLLTYSFDPIFSNVENKTCLNMGVKESVRNLLKQMVDYDSNSPVFHLPKPTTVEGPTVHSNSQEKDYTNDSLKPGDWRCLKCNFTNFSRNINCLRCNSLNEEKLRQIREEQEHLPLKKGDWVCNKCSLLNFARNTRCWQCTAKPPKRQLNPGEWECESCNYLNFRRNAACLKCQHSRPKSLNFSNVSMQPKNGKGRNHATGGSLGPPSLLRRQGRYTGLNEWRYVDVEEEIGVREQLNSVGETSRFIDFPIIGGKSDLSRDIREKEEWRLKMVVVEQNAKNPGRQRESRNGSQSCRFPKKPETPEHTCEKEDMADWFGVNGKP